MGHSARTCVIGMRIATDLGLPAETRPRPPGSGSLPRTAASDAGAGHLRFVVAFGSRYFT